MKIINRLLLPALLLAWSAGCISDEPPYRQEETPAAAASGTGFLSTEGITLRVIADTQTDIRPDQTSRRATRAGEDLSAYTIDISNAGGEVCLSTTYGELCAMAEPLELPVGSYRMYIRSEAAAATPAAAWDHPVYGTFYDFPIRKDAVTEIEEEITCTMQNIKVTLICSADLAEQLSDDTRATVTLGTEQMTFEKGETRAAFFMPAESSNTLIFQLTGSFTDGGDVSFTKEIAGVEAGQWRKITLVIAHSDEGGIKTPDIQVDTFVLDDPIDIDASAGLWEPVIDDSPVAAPVVEWAGHDLSEEFRLTAAMFSPAGGSYVCTEPFEIAVSAPGGIGSCSVTIDSTDEAMLASLESYGLPRTFDLCTLTDSDPAAATLRRFGFPLGDELRGQTEASFNLAGAMTLLYLYPGYDGTHTFSFRITDMQDPDGLHAAEGALRIRIDRTSETAGAGSIKWVGYDIDLSEPYEALELTADMQIDIDIQIPAGIRNFDVAIDSPALEPFLVALSIPTRFDLCQIEGDIATEGTLAAMLHSLGFPVNDEVRGKSSFDPLFSITSFVELIPMTAFETGVSTYNFTLTITDNNGEVTDGTIRLKVTKP